MDIKAKLSKLLLLIFATFAVTSCEKMIFDDEGDCSLHCLVKFKYDRNMKFADAFPNTVSYVTVYVYDADTHELVLKQVESGEALSREGYSMELRDLKPGTYDIVAWCGDGLADGNFYVNKATAGTSMLDETWCKMEREEDGKVTKDVGQLYHGKQRVTFSETYGTHSTTIDLTKNTNTVRVVLQHLSGLDVNPNDFRFEIQDENGYMAYDNTILDDEILSYSPWSVTAGKADINADIYHKQSTRTQTSVSVALAEFTIGRLVTGNNPVLSIYNVQENKKVLSIPLKDYALLVKGYYNRAMDDQEYLDRQDEYNLTFFLDEHGLWASSRIIINSWHLVFQNTDL